MGKRKLIALAFPLGVPHLEGVFRGIVRYVRQRRLRWSFLTASESWALSFHQLRGWNGDGAVVMINTPTELRGITRARFRVVNISDALIMTSVPSVTVDNGEIGRIAADHLLAVGLRRFAYYGLHQTRYAQERGTAFVSRLEDLGHSCARHEARPRFDSPHVDWMKEQKDLAKWLKSLEKPLGLLTASDPRARIALEACRLSDLRVPDDVAILGVNNDVTICEHCNPPLSSVSCNSELVGQKAAAMLDRLVSGRRLETREILVPPDGIVQRRSTDVRGVPDEPLVAAIRFIQTFFHQDIDIPDVVRHAGVSRRHLECEFREVLGMSPYEYLCRTRLEHARQQLRDSAGARLCDVAASSGFGSAKRMHAVFLRLTGITPREYREKPSPGVPDLRPTKNRA